MIVHPLFPQPVHSSKLDRALTKKELKTISQYKKKPAPNAGNTTSSENYVLENKALNNLKKDLHTKVMDYFDKVMCVSNSIIPHITQSWINYTETNQFHHKHSHSNSLISGVFYISADKKIDSIKFYKTPLHEPIQLNVTKYNVFNSINWKFPVETGDVFLFRSSLEHGVDEKKGKNMRISLSFNVFVKGTLGDKSELTQLILK